MDDLLRIITEIRISEKVYTVLKIQLCPAFSVWHCLLFQGLLRVGRHCVIIVRRIWDRDHGWFSDRHAAGGLEQGQKWLGCDRFVIFMFVLL